MNIINKILSKYYLFLIKRKKNIKIFGTISIIGKPIIAIEKECNLEIFDNVKLNSNNTRYHINMHSPVKLFADRKGAKVVIKKNTRIHGSCLHAYKYIEIGENCLIAANCQIFDNNGHKVSLKNPADRITTEGLSRAIIIGNNVWVGANSIILPGTNIEDGCVVGAGSIVKGKFNKRQLISGNPAKAIRRI